MITAAHAQLLIGTKLATEKEALAILQQSLCSQSACGICFTCTQINSKLHHSTIWIAPEKRYSVDDLEIIFQKTQLGLDQDELCFFIITKADFLNQTCANSLLKIVEEPPHGYQFLFLAERSEAVLPTIKSRCVQKNCTSTGLTEELPGLVHHFKSFHSDPISFSKELSSCTMTEQDCLSFIDELLRYWVENYKRAIQTQNATQSSKSLAMITLLKEALAQPPAPGSSKIFWKHLYLQRELYLLQIH